MIRRFSACTGSQAMEQASTSSADYNHIREWLKYNFPILVGEFEPEVRNDAWEATQESLKALPEEFCVHRIVVPRIHEHMRKVTAPRFWSKFKDAGSRDERQGFMDFTSAVNELYEETGRFLPMLKKLQLAGRCDRDGCLHGRVEPIEYFRLMQRATLLSQLPLRSYVLPGHFYRVAFNVFCNIEATTGVAPGGSGRSTASTPPTTGAARGICEGCSHELPVSCRCQAIVDTFHEINKQLLELGLLERLVGNTLTWLIEARIEEHVARVCARSFDSSQLQPLDTWLETVVMRWLVRIYAGGSSRCSSFEPHQRAAINTFKQKLSYFMYEAYTRQRIEQLFNIVIEYPDSRPAIDDLRVCLERTDMRRELVRSLKAAFRSRLLHPGVSTPDILTAYIAAIKALRQLEPRGVLLETITEPIKRYLRGREDTVRCVVSGLLDESSTSELADELSKGGAPPNSAGPTSAAASVNATVAEEQQDWESWQPDPVDTAFDESDDRQLLLDHVAVGDALAVAGALAQPYEVTTGGGGGGGPRKVSDIITMLVNVYGSQDLFVNEYRTLLADRLLTQLNYQTERELRQLELLKRRFGEQQLHHCEVMIKDMHDSKRIDEHIQADKTYCAECAEAATAPEGSASFPTSALVLSAQFWPPFKEDWRLELPGPVQRQLQRYVRAFEAYKGSRTLSWKTHLGNVNLDVETSGGRKLNLNVSPIHASIILCFERRTEWSLDDLAAELHVPATVLRRKIGLWLSHGLLAEKPDARDTFVTVEAAPAGTQAAPHQAATAVVQPAGPIDMILDEEELESAMASASDQREEELQVFWSYIVGMLTNLDSMPLDRIHQMLKMFASQGSGAVECGLPELRLFLDKKVREHQLLFSGGLYKLPKP